MTAPEGVKPTEEPLPLEDDPTESPQEAAPIEEPEEGSNTDSAKSAASEQGDGGAEKSESLVDKIKKLGNPKLRAPSGLAEKEQDAFYGHLKDQKRLDLGLIGFLIGHGIEKLGNIAFVVILMCFSLLVGLLWHPVPDSLNALVEKVVGQLFSIVTLALGYLFGKTQRSKDD